MKRDDSSSTGEAWDSIQRLRSADPNERNQVTLALPPQSSSRANSMLRFADVRLPQARLPQARLPNARLPQSPYESAPYGPWKGDTGAGANLTATLLRFASTPMQYPFRSVVFMEGQDSVGIWLLCSGRVRLSRSSAAGKNVTLRMAHAGEPLGLSAVIAHDSLRMAAQTAEPCTLAFIDRAHLFRIMRNTEMACLVTEALSREVQATYSSTGDLLLARSARARIARVLLSVDSEDLHSHLQVSELAGCSRETVTRLLGAMQRDGLIAYEHGQMRLLDEAGIQAICE
jgi:CRP/FNR family transcriptional regulator